MFDNEIRNNSIIERWMTVRMHRRSTLGEHSHRVAIYADQIAEFIGLPKSMRLDIVRYALWHDMPEIFTGDLPGPLKASGIIDRLKLRAHEDEGMRKRFTSGWTMHHGNVIAAVVKTADLLDEILEIVIERRMGNGVIPDSIYDGTTDALVTSITAMRQLIDDEPSDDAKVWSHRVYLLYGEVAHAIARHSKEPMHGERR